MVWYTNSTTAWEALLFDVATYEKNHHYIIHHSPLTPQENNHYANTTLTTHHTTHTSSMPYSCLSVEGVTQGPPGHSAPSRTSRIPRLSAFFFLFRRREGNVLNPVQVALRCGVSESVRVCCVCVCASICRQ